MIRPAGSFVVRPKPEADPNAAANTSTEATTVEASEGMSQDGDEDAQPNFNQQGGKQRNPQPKLDTEGMDEDQLAYLRAQAAQDAAIAWAQLTALNGANRLGKPKLGATILAANQQGEPMIVCQNYGSGRSLAIAFDTTWQWVLNPKDLAEYQRRFWRQVALYLASPRGNVWIGTDRSTYDLRRMQMGAEPIEVTAGVEDAFGTPAPQGLKEVTLTLAGGQPAPVSLQRNGDIFKTKLPPQSTAGLYVLNITAELAGKTLTAEHRFEVVQRDLEGMEALANFALLRQMAEASGGRFVTLSELPALLKDLRQAAKPKKRVEVSQEDIAANIRWPIILTLITLICLEWAMRKRRGLV